MHHLATCKAFFGDYADGYDNELATSIRKDYDKINDLICEKYLHQDRPTEAIEKAELLSLGYSFNRNRAEGIWQEFTTPTHILRVYEQGGGVNWMKADVYAK